MHVVVRRPFLTRGEVVVDVVEQLHSFKDIVSLETCPSLIIVDVDSVCFSDLVTDKWEPLICTKVAGASIEDCTRFGTVVILQSPFKSSQRRRVEAVLSARPFGIPCL